MNKTTTTKTGKSATATISKFKQPKTIIIISCVIVFVVLALIGGRFVLTKAGVLPDSRLGYVQEYVAGTGNIKGDVNLDNFSSKSSDFEIGANQYGYAVFKNPNKAFDRLKRDYKSGIKLVQQEFNLPPLNNFTFKQYKIYAWQVNSGSAEEQKQALFVSQFLDIYENSFN